MLDHFIYGSVERISPEAPVPVVRAKREEDTVGGCGNVIRNLRNLGVNVNIISAVGVDKVGETIKAKLVQLGIDTTWIVDVSNIRSTHKMRVIAENQHVVRVDWDAVQLTKKDYERLALVLEKNVDNVDGVIVSDYNKGVCKNDIVQAVMNKARDKGIPVFVDPKGTDWKKYAGAFCITPNAKEAQSVLTISCNNDDEIASAGKQICKEFEIDNCLITRGKNGMSLINKNEVFHIPSRAREVFDVSGAGDTVISCIAAAVVAGAKLPNAVEFANAAAGIVVGHVGTAAITLEELEQL